MKYFCLIGTWDLSDGFYLGTYADYACSCWRLFCWRTFEIWDIDKKITQQTFSNNNLNIYIIFYYINLKSNMHFKLFILLWWYLKWKLFKQSLILVSFDSFFCSKKNAYKTRLGVCVTFLRALQPHSREVYNKFFIFYLKILSFFEYFWYSLID